MKIVFKRIALLVIFSMFALGASAQIDRERDSEYFPRNEIYIQYGAPSVTELVTVLQVDYKSTTYGGESRNHKFSGVGSLGYNFSINKKFAVGIYAGVSYSSADLYITYIDGVNLKDPFMVCRSEIINYSGLLSASMIYWQKGAWECSGELYLGAAYLHENIDPRNEEYMIPEPNSRFKLAYHLTPVKIRYGDEIGFFAELGFGCRGLVNVGLSVKI